MPSLSSSVLECQEMCLEGVWTYVHTEKFIVHFFVRHGGLAKWWDTETKGCWMYEQVSKIVLYIMLPG
jgi:hypothetical protein